MTSRYSLRFVGRLPASLAVATMMILSVAAAQAQQAFPTPEEAATLVKWDETLRIIAEAISMHESTVSRVTSNKYIATPRGLFELKYFFTASIQAVNGQESHSAEAVRDRIREMIENEEPREILSDDRIVSLLTADGVNIARRTVAKYREALRIPSSVERRRLKAGAVA